ncbi:MAG TPA: hypothetical protein VGV59_07155 [Pyrinomonadaceae bacterium]|nr:hypothetical protein [Pyrinomonadaceae bacterium]
MFRRTLKTHFIHRRTDITGQRRPNLSRNTNTDPPQPGDQPELPPTQPEQPDAPDPLPLPPDSEPTPRAPVREPDPAPLPAGDPQPSEPTRLV